MLRRIVKEEIFLLEDDQKHSNITLHNGVYKRLLFENGTFSWCCTDVDRTIYTHKNYNTYWLAIHDLLEKLYINRITAENRDIQIDEILL